MDGVITSASKNPTADARTSSQELLQTQLDIEVTKLEHITRQLNTIKSSSISDPRILTLEADMNRQVEVVEELVKHIQRSTLEIKTPLPQTKVSQTPKKQFEGIKRSIYSSTKAKPSPALPKTKGPLTSTRDVHKQVMHSPPPLENPNPIVISAGAIRFSYVPKNTNHMSEQTTEHISESTTPFRVFTVNTEDIMQSTESSIFPIAQLEYMTPQAQRANPRTATQAPIRIKQWYYEVKSYQTQLESILGRLHMLERRKGASQNISLHKEVVEMLCCELDRVDDMITKLSQHVELVDIQQTATDYLAKLELLFQRVTQVDSTSGTMPMAAQLFEAVLTEKAKAQQLKTVCSN